MLSTLFAKIEPLLSKVYHRLRLPPPPNLLGDRDVEFSWIAANIPSAHGRALDCGCGSTWNGLLAARRGFDVTAVDLSPPQWPYRHQNLSFVQGDILSLDMDPRSFDLIISCSVVEHIGLAGRYGARENPDGDIACMRKMLSLLKPGGLMLLTIPVGRDRVFPPKHRVYGPTRLPRILEGWNVAGKEFWLKDGENLWGQSTEALTLDREATDHCYGLGLFSLTPSEREIPP